MGRYGDGRLGAPLSRKAVSEHVVLERELGADLMQRSELHLRACHAESGEQLCIPRPGAEHEGVCPQAHCSEVEFHACTAAHEAGADIRFMDELMFELDGERLDYGRHIEHGFIQTYDEAFETALGQERGPGAVARRPRGPGAGVVRKVGRNSRRALHRP